MQEWVADANQAVSLRLVRDPKDESYKDIVGINGDRKVLEPFHPTFTYPIFGDKEVIFGYKGLKVRIDMASGSLKEYLSITYREKINSTATPADDIEGILYKFVPSDYTKNAKTFADTVQKDAETFVPPGVRIAAYAPVEQASTEKVEYGIYKCKWDTPGFREFHRRAQLFILLYIEAGSYIQEDEDEWEFLLTFETRTRTSGDTTTTSYHFVGYVSAYPFWCYPDNIRLRLSQFVILPPFQGKGHGSQLYNALWNHISTRPEVSELTIEDPSEHFEDLRDRNDLTRLRKLLGQSKEILSGAPVDKTWMEKTRKELKYAKRQFLRIIEIMLLEQLKYRKNDPNAYKALRLQVKERLYRFNYEILSQVEPEERKQKLQETYANVEEDYKRLLAIVLSKSPFLRMQLDSAPPGHPIWLPPSQDPMYDDAVEIVISSLYASYAYQQVNARNARSILYAADMLQLPDMVSYAFKVCRQSISVDNIIDWVEWIEAQSPPRNDEASGSSSRVSTPLSMADGQQVNGTHYGYPALGLEGMSFGTASQSDGAGNGQRQETSRQTSSSGWQDVLSQPATSYTAQLKQDVYHYLTIRLPQELQQRDPDTPLTQNPNFKGIIVQLPFDLFKTCIEDPILPLGSDQERFAFAKSTIQQRRKRNAARSLQGQPETSSVVENVVLRFGGGSGSKVHITRKSKQRSLWKVEKE
ncbi:histone acetyltransferase 1 [Naganishia albida]|nr:histone acetyltransferase 1 [Naganishia albida]